MHHTEFNLQPRLVKPLEEMAQRFQKSTDWVINQALEAFLLREETEAKR